MPVLDVWCRITSLLFPLTLLIGPPCVLCLAVFILSNAIICSVSVWNFFIAQAINQYCTSVHSVVGGNSDHTLHLSAYRRFSHLCWSLEYRIYLLHVGSPNFSELYRTVSPRV